MGDPVFISAISILFISSLYSLVSALLRKKFTPKDSNELQQELKEWSTDKERAKKTGDKQLLAKLRKKEKRMLQIQAKMFKGQILNMVIVMGLFYVMYWGLGFLYGSYPVAYLPFSIPFIFPTPDTPLPFFYWYLICSFLSSTLLQRILGVSTGLGTQK